MLLEPTLVLLVGIEMYQPELDLTVSAWLSGRQGLAEVYAKVGNQSTRR
jgi:hypothetical protein